MTFKQLYWKEPRTPKKDYYGFIFYGYTLYGYTFLIVYYFIGDNIKYNSKVMTNTPT